MQKKGFTILEVIVAIFILTVAVGGSFILTQQTLIAASLAQSKLKAYYLAQEGIEIVRNIRDSNWIRQRTDLNFYWDTYIDIDENLVIDGSAGNYIVDYNDDRLKPFEDRYLSVDESGFYSYDTSDDPTLFKRTIYISKKSIAETPDDPDDYKLLVTIRIDWSERGRSHNIEVSEYLYNWHGYQ